MAVEPLAPHRRLNAFISDSLVVIQPHVPATSSAAAGRADVVETLSIDLASGTVQQLLSEPQRVNPVPIMTVLGVARLFKGYAVLLATSARVVATILGADVYEVTGTRIITSKGFRTRDNRGLLRLLHQGLDPDGVGRSMYFSHYYDITLSAQRASVIAQDTSPIMQTAAGRADKTFFWNHALVQPLIDAGAHRFVVPVVFGFIKQLPDLQLSGPSGSANGSLTMIARRGVQRAGTRHWRRGADQDGNVANFVESEQLLQVTLPGGTAPVVASYVQVRGSIPLLWTELPNLKYKPTKVIGPVEVQVPVFTKHLQRMHESYRHVVAINLINQHGGEGKLEKAFRQGFEVYLSSGGKDARYVPFDFHKQCGAKNYERMSFLWDEVAPDVACHGYFLHNGGGVASRQQGVMRTNCIDCLDRTNVVQGMLARKNLEQVLGQLGLMPKGQTLPQAYPAIEREFKILWADHGDAIATQYAGTGALKSGFTRTGKRTVGGILDDGVKSVSRYYLNNFQDGGKQDAVDLVTGAYVPVPGTKAPFKRQSSPLVPLVLALLLITLAVKAATEDLHQGVHNALGSTQGLFMSVVAPLMVSVLVLVLTVKNGKHLVNKPQLCPALAATVTKPKKQ